MKSLWILAITSFIATGCDTNTTTPKIQLQQTYIVEWIGERPLMDYSHLTIVLDNNNKAHGFAGCNNWQGRYNLNGNKIQFEQIITTRKHCAPSLMEQEQRFIQALPNIVRWDFSEVKQLRLWPKEGQPIRLWPEKQK